MSPTQHASNFFCFCWFVLKRFFSNNSLDTSATLTYTALFAVVPTMTVAFTLVSSIPEFNSVDGQIQNFIFEHFLPDTGQSVRSYLTGFVDQARQLKWVGIVSMMFTAFLMIIEIEGAFNRIWQISKARSGKSRFLMYWSLISFGPILMALGFLITTYFTSLPLIQQVTELPGSNLMMAMISPAFSAFCFAWLYWLLPNTRVPIKNAIIGGIFTAICLEMARYLFTFFVTAFPTYHFIYGAFAAIPIFLLWIYLSWVFVLLGAELVCNLEYIKPWRHFDAPKFLLMYGILQLIYHRYGHAQSTSLQDAQAINFDMTEPQWNEIIGFLESEQLLHRVGTGEWSFRMNPSQFNFEKLVQKSPWPIPDAKDIPDNMDKLNLAHLKSALLEFARCRECAFGQPLSVWLGKHEVAPISST